MTDTFILDSYNKHLILEDVYNIIIDTPLTQDVRDAALFEISTDFINNTKVAFVNEVLSHANIVLTEDQITDAIIMCACNSSNYRIKFYNQIYLFSASLHSSFINIHLTYNKHIGKTIDKLSFPFSSKHYSICWKDMSIIRTQKVRGIMSLLSMSPSSSIGEDLNVKFYNPIYTGTKNLLENCVILPYDTNIDHLVGRSIFARPCPTRPRHGFIESQTVTSKKAIEQLFVNIKRRDPSGEMILMYKATAKYSSVLTPFSYSVGSNNDGATSGNAVTIPLPNNPILNKSDLSLAGITETPYVEFVEHHGNLEPVQLRNGPKPIVADEDFIPYDIPKVENIIYCDTDLIQYEFLIKNAPPNSVVYAPDKGMTSHYAAHAFANNIPFLTKPIHTYELYGSYLKANVDKDHTTSGDWSKIAEYIQYYLNVPAYILLGSDFTSKSFCSSIANPVTFSITMGHLSLICNKNNDKTNQLIAKALTCFIATYIASLLGELRHYKEHQKQYENAIKQTTESIPPCMYLPSKESQESRGGTYRAALRYSVAEMWTRTPSIEVDFMSPIWGHGTSYGGGRWASSTASMQRLQEKLLQFLKTPTRQLFNETISEWHTCINEEHNGGRILSKFICGYVFDLAANYPFKNLIQSGVTAFIAGHHTPTNDDDIDNEDSTDNEEEEDIEPNV